MNRFTRLISATLSAVMLVSLAACGSSNTDTGTTPPVNDTQEIVAFDGQETPTQSSKDSLIMGYTKEPDTIAPGSDAKTNAQMVVAMCHDTIVGKDPSDQSVIVPSISDTWEFSGDGTEIIFHIRDDIKFHDGTALSVEDVLFSLNYATQQGLNSSGASILKGWEDAGDNNIKVTLAYPYKPILQILATPGFSIISKATYEKAQAEGKNFGMMENGTGPYKLVKWTTGDRIILEANNSWHRGAPAIKKVEVRLCSDETSGGLMIENGEIDFFIGMNSADRPRFLANDKLNVISATSAGTYVIAMNLKEGPFADNLALREAVAYAINRQDILDGGMNGVGEVTPGPITPGYFGFVDGYEAYPYNPEMAKAKLAEAGYPNGIDVSFKTASDSWYSNPSQVIVEQLRQVGIRCNFEIMERAPYLKEVQEDMNYEMCYYMTWGDFPDADPVMWGKFHSETIGKQMQNFAGVDNPDVDALLLKARTSIDDSERKALYANLAEMNKENVWYLMILTTYNSMVINNDLQGVEPIPSGYYNPAFYYWK